MPDKVDEVRECVGMFRAGWLTLDRADLAFRSSLPEGHRSEYDQLRILLATHHQMHEEALIAAIWFMLDRGCDAPTAIGNALAVVNDGEVDLLDVIDRVSRGE
jgi:hypothetical protein